MSEPPVDIVIAGGPEGAPLEHCTGPDASGLCPRVAAGEIVACAAHSVRMDGAPFGNWDMRVAADATVCPYAFMLARV
jgi:hypothetical protein